MTAVEWLYEKLTNNFFDIKKSKEALEKAKEMEKQQKIDFANKCIHKWNKGDVELGKNFSQHCYKETYEGKACAKCGANPYKMGKPYCTDDFCNKEIFLDGYEQVDQNNPVTRGSTALVKKEQKKLITEIMNEDAKDGLYGSKEGEDMAEYIIP